MIYNDPPDNDSLDGPDDDEIWLLFTICAKKLVKSADRQLFLDWIADTGPKLAPQMADRIDPHSGSIEDAFRAFGLEIYQAMPLPEHNFRRPAALKTGRNEPCPCGSERKYKQCCQPLQGRLFLHDLNLLPFVLDTLPRKVYSSLPDSDVDIDMIADTARQWLEKNKAREVVLLLEPFFAAKHKLTARHALLFDQLMDCYLELGNPRKRNRLIDHVLNCGDRFLQANALQRRASIEADSNDFEAAWSTFEEARRLDPEDPNLAPLEISLLMSQEKPHLAQERARFWVARLRRTGNPEHASLINFLEEVANDPYTALSGLAGGMQPGIELLAESLASAPPVAAHYKLKGGKETCLEPDHKLDAVERVWQQVFPQIKPGLTAIQHGDPSVWDAAPDWLPVLESSPYAWQSFDILDDLIMAVDAVQLMGLGETLVKPLLERGTSLLEINLAALASPGVTLSWGFLQNRPALRILAHRAYLSLDRLADGSREPDLIKPAEWLLSLNPMDNHGMREPLTRAYLACGAPQKTLELCDRYPDDFCGMTLNRVLALYRLGRLDEALETLAGSIDQTRVAVRMLLAKNPAQPKLSGYGITLGGKDEAWLYRQAHLALWVKEGALEWLRKVSKGLQIQ